MRNNLVKIVLDNLWEKQEQFLILKMQIKEKFQSTKNYDH